MATVAAALFAILNVLKVVFGLGFVIFIHELGHFLAAKWAGVKVEKFFLGFDPGGLRVAQFRRGETTYGIGAIPLGGYVKMLGESPEEGEEASGDPRAFGNKSIAARTVILSAGVAMNLLLGLALFTATQMLGVTEMPARVGAVQAGSPAYEAGLRPGDEIVAIDGRGDVTFRRLLQKGSLSGPNHVLKLGVRRPGSDELLSFDVAPKRRAKADQPTIGVAMIEGLELAPERPFRAPPGLDGPAPKPDAVPAGGTVVEAGPSGGAMTPVVDILGLDRILAEGRDGPVDVVIEAPSKDKPGSAPTRSRVALPPNRVLGLGLRMTPGPVTSIQAGSIASRAGFRVGDRIIRVDGRDDFDPIRLPFDLFDRAGKPTAFDVEREAGGKKETVAIEATPDASIPGVDPLLVEDEALKLPGLGLAMAIEPVVAAVAPDGPASRAGIRPGAVVEGLTIPPDPEEGRKAKPIRLAFGKAASKEETEASWYYASRLLQVVPKGEVEVRLAGASKPVALTPEPDKTWSNPRRGLAFVGVFRDVPPQPLVPAVRRALAETSDNVVGIYSMIRSLFAGLVSPKNLAGLPRIAVISYQTASLGLVPLLQFLGMLSINLAVLNFLPIPPLDGGQIAFLVAEKIRGKPLPDSALTVLMIAGLVLVAFLMLFTIIQDFVLMIFG